MEPNEPDESRLLACVKWIQAVDRLEPRERYMQWKDVPDSLQAVALEAFRRKYRREPREVPPTP